MLPLLAGIGAGLAVPVVNRLLGGESEEGAQSFYGDERRRLISSAIAQGIDQSEAETMADDELKEKVREKMSEGFLPDWAEIGLSLAAGGAGASLAKFGAKGLSSLASDKASKASQYVMKTMGRKGSEQTISKADDVVVSSANKAQAVPERGFTLPAPDGGVMPMTADELAFMGRAKAVRSVPQRPTYNQPVYRIGEDAELALQRDVNRMRGKMYAQEGG
jgi:hypothetical protein